MLKTPRVRSLPIERLGATVAHDCRRASPLISHCACLFAFVCLAGSIAFAMNVRLMAEHYEVPVLLHSDHCAKKVRASWPACDAAGISTAPRRRAGCNALTPLQTKK